MRRKTREIQTVPCKWCGDQTQLTGTQECDKHWELRRRIELEPSLAVTILKSIGAYV